MILHLLIKQWLSMKYMNLLKRRIVHTLHESHLKHIIKEMGLFIGMFFCIFIVSIIFVNANLVYHTIKSLFQPVQASEYVFSSDNISTILENRNALDNFIQENNNELKDLKKDHNLFVSSRQKIETSLQKKDYDFSYTLTPPGNRIFIGAIGLDAPIIDIDYVSEEKLKHGDFNSELYSGVVKYPSTPEPGSKGNTLIFGHTSYYRWKKNPYGEVFAKIYDLKKGDEIKVSWKGQLYTYEIIESVVVKPGEVDKKYMEYTDGEYITLMGCYPIGSDARRGLIIAKRKKTSTTPTFAFSQQ